MQTSQGYMRMYIYVRAVKISALIYAINVAAINALKYFNALIFFTPLPPSPLTRQQTSQWEPVIPHSPTPLV